MYLWIQHCHSVEAAKKKKKKKDVAEELSIWSSGVMRWNGVLISRWILRKSVAWLVRTRVRLRIGLVRVILGCFVEINKPVALDSVRCGFLFNSVKSKLVFLILNVSSSSSFSSSSFFFSGGKEQFKKKKKKKKPYFRCNYRRWLMVTGLWKFNRLK